MKKGKYILYLAVIIMIVLLPNTYAACTHPPTEIISTTNILKIGKSNHCRTLMKIKKCTVCNSVTKIESTTKLSVHTIKTKITSAATCNANGIRRSECTSCGYSYSTKIPIKDHQLSNYKTNTKKHYKTCSTCTRLFNNESHKFNSNYTCTTCGYKCKHPTVTEATCSKDGKCTLCGYVKTSKLGHKLSGFIANAEKGHYRKCTRTGCTYKSQESTHGILDGTCVKCGYVKVCKHANKIFPTCTKAGSCKDCGTIFSKLGHNYIDGVCNRTNCNAKEPVKEPAKDTENIEDIVIKPSDSGSAATCTHGVKSSVTCTKPSTCIKCGMEFGEPLPHDYVYDEWNISNEYHYVFCQICWRTDSIKTEKHNFDSAGKCTVCNYINGSKIEENVDAPEILGCDHGNTTVTVVTKEATCIDTGEEEVKCMTCDYSKVNVLPKNNFHTYDSAAGYRVTVKYHQICCTGCGVADSNNREEHDFNKDGICKVCEYICRHPSCEEGAACSYCGYSSSNICDKHKWEMKIDDLGHWQTCSECGYKNKDAGEEKYGIHVYADGIIDAGNGKHERICIYKECRYKLQSVHLWVNDECISCGSKNSTGLQDIYTETREFNPDNEEQLKELQEHLKKLGYYNSDIDAIWGKGTLTAINNLLEDQGCNRILNSSEKWSGITPEIYTLIMNCEETIIDATMRELEPLISSQTATEEQAVKLLQAKLVETGYYKGAIDGKISKDFETAFSYYCVLNNIDLKNTTLSFELINSITKNDETKVQAVERVRKERKEEMRLGVEEKGIVYFAELTYGQLYSLPSEFSYGRAGSKIPEWGELLTETMVDCSYMMTYTLHEAACYYGDTALEDWTTVAKDSIIWKKLGELVELKHKIENGDITDEATIRDFYSHYDEEARTYTTYVDYYGSEVAFPIDSFNLLWSVNDGTSINECEFPAGAIVIERQKSSSGHVEMVREDGSTAVYTAGGKEQWAYEGKRKGTDEYYTYDRRTDHSYVLELKTQ